MREPENIRAVAELGIDWMGFIFYDKSPRYYPLPAASPEEGGGVFPLPGGVKGVGVFVNAAFGQMLEAVDTCRLHYLQLHGEEPPGLCRSLREHGTGVIKAFSILTEEDVEKTREYEGYADYFLFDTKCRGYGGSGVSFDWSVLAAYQGETPFLLSGGIHPGSLEDIRQFRHPRFAGIDLNSGFETAPGVKDTEKLKQHLTLMGRLPSNRGPNQF
jgi:phosphoribosylanthranilate isomerase